MKSEKKSRRSTMTYGAFACFLAAACLPGQRAQSQQAYPRRTLVQQTVIGGDSAGQAFNFGGVGTVRFARDGRVVVFDYMECNIKVFSASGVYQRTLGKAGAGPGEFSCPSAGADVENDTIVVMDPQQNRTVRFALSGAHIRTEARPTFQGDRGLMRSMPLRHGYRFLTDGRLSVVRGSVATFDPWSYHTLRKPGGSGRVDTIAKTRTDFAFVKSTSAPNGRPAATGFGRAGAVAVSGDSILVIIDGYEGTVTWHLVSETGLRVLKSASLMRRGRPVTSRDLREAEPRIRAYGRFGREGNVTISEAPPMWSVADKARFVEDGSLWIGAPSQGAPSVVWVVFPQTGAPYEVETPADFYPGSTRGDLVVSGGVTALDAPVVRVYRLVSNPPRSL